MTFRSLWTGEAEASFLSILAFLGKEWGQSVADAFASDVMHTIALLQVFPRGGTIEVRQKRVRSIPVVRQVRLFYRVEGDSVIILEFIDTRSERYQDSRE